MALRYRELLNLRFIEKKCCLVYSASSFCSKRGFKCPTVCIQLIFLNALSGQVKQEVILVINFDLTWWFIVRVFHKCPKYWIYVQNTFRILVPMSYTRLVVWINEYADTQWKKANPLNSALQSTIIRRTVTAHSYYARNTKRKLAVRSLRNTRFYDFWNNSAETKRFCSQNGFCEFPSKIFIFTRHT